MRATDFEPAAAAPIATPTIHCSSIGHPRPDVRCSPNSLARSSTSPVGSVAVGTWYS
jgi:hypothetical protein